MAQRAHIMYINIHKQTLKRVELMVNPPNVYVLWRNVTNFGPRSEYRIFTMRIKHVRLRSTVVIRVTKWTRAKSVKDCGKSFCI